MLSRLFRAPPADAAALCWDLPDGAALPDDAVALGALRAQWAGDVVAQYVADKAGEIDAAGRALADRRAAAARDAHAAAVGAADAAAAARLGALTAREDRGGALLDRIDEAALAERRAVEPDRAAAHRRADAALGAALLAADAAGAEKAAALRADVAALAAARVAALRAAVAAALARHEGQMRGAASARRNARMLAAAAAWWAAAEPPAVRAARVGVARWWRSHGWRAQLAAAAALGVLLALAAWWMMGGGGAGWVTPGGALVLAPVLDADDARVAWLRAAPLAHAAAGGATVEVDTPWGAAAVSVPLLEAYMRARWLADTRRCVCAAHVGAPVAAALVPTADGAARVLFSPRFREPYPTAASAVHGDLLWPGGALAAPRGGSVAYRALSADGAADSAPLAGGWRGIEVGARDAACVARCRVNDPGDPYIN
jgi:hypothetical protein